VTNAALLTEVLYGKCVHELTYTRDEDQLQWFNYMYNVRQYCFASPENFFDELHPDISRQDIIDCALEQVRNVEISDTEV
jgi:hypothetical protein